VDRPVTATFHRQILRVVRVSCRSLLVKGDAEARLVAGMHVAVPERVVGVEQVADRVPVSHVLLDAEVGNAQVNVQCCG
jgi:hypothetical protein